MRKQRSKGEDVSAIILIGGKYDGELLKKTLKSISWCGEIIKVETPKIAGSFADWRNEGARRAKGRWLLYIDVDEELTKSLREEILRVVDRGSLVSGYAIPRRNFIFGKEFKHCGQWPDYVLRLIKKDKLVGWKGELHEQPEIIGETGYLTEPLIHRKNTKLADMVEKTNDWSEIEAKLMFEAHHPRMNFFRFFSAGFREFWLRMVVQAAFLDGTEGVIYALYQVFSRLISYSKLWELQLSEASSST